MSGSERMMPTLTCGHPCLTAQPGHKAARAAGRRKRTSSASRFDLVEVKTRIHNMLEVRLLYRKLEDYAKGA